MKKENMKGNLARVVVSSKVGQSLKERQLSSAFCSVFKVLLRRTYEGFISKIVAIQFSFVQLV